MNTASVPPEQRLRNLRDVEDGLEHEIGVVKEAAALDRARGDARNLQSSLRYLDRLVEDLNDVRQQAQALELELNWPSYRDEVEAAFAFDRVA